jgi:hypothetical protein
MAADSADKSKRTGRKIMASVTVNVGSLAFHGGASSLASSFLIWRSIKGSESFIPMDLHVL